MSLTTIVAQNLHALRVQRGLSQTALAKTARMSVSYISMLEREQRSPPLQTLEVLAKALKVVPLSLIDMSSPAPGRRRLTRRS